MNEIKIHIENSSTNPQLQGEITYPEGIELSVFLKRMGGTLDLTNSLDPQGDLRGYQTLLRFINALGWVEHTSDWDPFLEITFRDGTKGDTMGGYFLITDIDATHVLIDAIGAEEDSDLIDPALLKYWTPIKNAYVIPISVIQSLKLFD